MALKVFDLECANGHVFEGWFTSHDDYHAQQNQGLLSCPLCSSQSVTRRVAASRIQTGTRATPQLGHEGAGTQRAASEPISAADAARAGIPPSAPQLSPEMQAQLLQQMRHMVRAADNVGGGFAEEARRIHEGEAPERAIRGTATREEFEGLVQDGIAAVPIPAMLDDDKLQ